MQTVNLSIENPSWLIDEFDEAIQRAIAQLPPPVNFRSAKRCSVGYGCGATCITRSNQCRITLAGVQRDAANWVQTKARQGLELVKEKLQDEAIRDDLIVNTGGFLASQVGQAIGGNAGALVGDLAGALAVRAVITGRRAVMNGRAAAEREAGFNEAGRVERLRRTARATLQQMRQPEFLERVADDLTGDVAGWAIGNSSAAALGSAGVRIPFKGAVVAMATVPQVVQGRKRLTAWLQRNNQTAPAFGETRNMNEPKNKAELVEIINSVADSVLNALTETLGSIDDAPTPESLVDFTLEGEDFVGIFADTEAKRWAFRMGTEDIIYQPVAEEPVSEDL
jgi:hypothetical protein